MNHFKLFTMGLVSLSLLTFANADESVTGNMSGQEANSLGLEEIIVTARKREESLLDIPETVVAITLES